MHPPRPPLLPNPPLMPNPPSIMNYNHHFPSLSRQSHSPHIQQPRSNTRPRVNQKPTNDGTKIILKVIDVDKPTPTKEQLLRALCNKNIWANQVVPIDQGFLVIVGTFDAELLLSDAVAAHLSRTNLKTNMPRDLKHKLTLFVTGVDEDIGAKDAEEIKSEIEKEQKSLKIEKVIKIPHKTKMFIIQCKDSTTTNTILNHGFHAFSISVAPYQIALKRTQDVKICFKCYAFDTHFTKECRSTTKICSNCAEQGHTHYENRCATTQMQKCINCKRSGKPHDHHTLSTACPTRREHIKKKEENRQLHQVQQQSYVSAVNFNPNTANTEQQPPNTHCTTYKDTIKIMTLAIDATLGSLSDPSSYSQKLTKSIKDNFDVEVKISNHEREHESLRQAIVEAITDKAESMFNSETNNTDDGDLSPHSQNELPEDTSNNTDDHVPNQAAPVTSSSPCQTSAELETPKETSQSTHTPIRHTPAKQALTSVNQPTNSKDSPQTKQTTNDADESDPDETDTDKTDYDETDSNETDSNETDADETDSEESNLPQITDTAPPNTPPITSTKRKPGSSPELIPPTAEERQRIIEETVIHTPKKAKYNPANKHHSTSK